ncbi:MAG: DegT/DnrJ/EryC1/StrS family aminotransferase [Verrucomicrobiales bacterium]
MKIPFVDLYRQYTALQGEMDAAIASVIRESSFIRGPHVDAFEQKFSELVGVPHTVACANGTDAIYIVLKTLGIGAGDEVITTAHSWISTSETITQAGAKVVFCDTDPETFCIDPKKIESLITPRTKAIIPVHLYGHPADMDPILKIARKHGLKVIEDCAQAHLAMYHGRMIGTMGDAATFSFYPGKNLGAMGDAGCFVTADADLADRGATYARHGGKGEHVMEGINSRLDGLQAAILNVKIPHLEEWTTIRRGLAEKYTAALSKVSGITVPREQPNCKHVYHLYVIQHEQRDALKAHLERCGIGTVLNYPKALPFYAAYNYLGHTPEDFPTAYHHQSRILSLPIFPFMRDEELDYVVDSIASFGS